MKKDKMKEARKRAAEEKERRSAVKLSKKCEFLPASSGLLEEPAQNIDFLTMNPSRILNWLNYRWRNCPFELLGVLMVGLGWRYIGEQIIETGDTKHIISGPEQVIRPGIMADAVGVAVWHTHIHDTSAYFSVTDIEALQLDIKCLSACEIDFIGGYLITPSKSHYLTKAEIMEMDISKHTIDLDAEVVFQQYDENCKYTKYAIEHGAPVLNSEVNING